LFFLFFGHLMLLFMDFLLTWVVFLDGSVKWFTNDYLCLRPQNFRGNFFKNYTVQRNTHAHLPLWTCMQILPLWAPLKDWAPADLEIPEATIGLVFLVVDGNVAYHLTHNAGKSRDLVLCF
jgi:hypothetical protein